MPLMLTIVNDGTGDPEQANYDWTMWLVPRGNLNRLQAIDTGRVAGHRKGDGWRAIVGAIARGAPKESD